MIKGDITVLQDPTSPDRKIWVMLEVAGTAYISYGATVGNVCSRSDFTKIITTGRAMLQKKWAEYPASWCQPGVVVVDSRSIEHGVDDIMRSVFSTFYRDSGRGVDVSIALRILSGAGGRFEPSDPTAPVPVPAPDLSASLGSIIPEATWIF